VQHHRQVFSGHWGRNSSKEGHSEKKLEGGNVPQGFSRVPGNKLSKKNEKIGLVCRKGGGTEQEGNLAKEEKSLFMDSEKGPDCKGERG